MLLFYAIVVALVGVLATILVRAVASPLASIPGPLLARFTRLWFLARVAGGRFEADNVALHRRYGPIVRVAPDTYSIDLPEAVGAVYGVGSPMRKSAWYDGWRDPTRPTYTLFSDRSRKRHGETRRRFQALYNMTSLVSYEGYVDACAELLLQRIDEFAEAGTVFDMMHWFQCYAFDVISNITYSARFGFLDRGEDVPGLLTALQSTVTYGALAGIVPELHPFLYRVMAWLGLGGAAGRAYLTQFVQRRTSERRAERAEGQPATSPDGGMPQSFLDKLLDQNEQDPAKVTDAHVFMMGLSNIIAGADTTAITLSAVLHHLLRNPAALATLREEVDKMGGGDDDGHVRFQDAQNMPYLQAVLMEAMRLHAATGLPLWRDVAVGGAVLGGRFFPEGTTVGVNTWCAHYNETVFGADAREFRPERWLVAPDKAKAMHAYYLPVRFFSSRFVREQRGFAYLY